MSEATVFIARLMAPYLVVTGLGFLVSRRFYLRMLFDSESAHPILINLSGMVHFLIGMAVVLTHLRFGSVLGVVVTLIGFAFVAKGFVLIVIPELSLKSNQTTSKRLPLIGAGFIAAGAYLAYASYFAAG